jgi:cell volume regulation protein A
MVSATITNLTFLAIILFIGIICSIISSRFRLPNVLLLLVFGVLLNSIKYNGKPLVYFPNELVAAIAVLAVAMIVFDSASRLKLRSPDTLDKKALELAFVFFLFAVVIISAVSHYLLKIDIFYSIIFASLMAGTAADVALGKAKNHALHILNAEAAINTLLVIFIPLIVLNIRQTMGVFAMDKLASQIVPLIQQIATGIGAGILVGLLVFRIVKKNYYDWLSPIILIASALLAYVLAENINGNPVLAAATIGIFFGLVRMKEKEEMQSFSSVFSHLLMILVIIMVGLLVNIAPSWKVMMNALIIYLIVCVIRIISIKATADLSNKEAVFMALNAPKGVAVAVVVLILSTMALDNFAALRDTALIVMIYSLFVSSLAMIFTKQLVGKQ